MRGLYIAAIDKVNPLDLGVFNKIEGQLSGLNSLGVKMDKLLIENKNIYFNNSCLYSNLKKPIYMTFFLILNRKFNEIKDDYDFVYIRFSRNNIFYYQLVKKFSKENIKVITEIPTYPYDEEFERNTKQYIYRQLDKLITKNLYKYVYRISTTNDYKEIFNIPTIQIRNAVNFEKIKKVKNKDKHNSINLVGIANLAKWHGYDRIIEGLSIYNIEKNKNYDRDVHFYIVGEGTEKEKLEQLVDKLNLRDKVFFLGAKSGASLDELFDKMDLGVSSLALHRAGGGHDPIKTKEFLARGIPVILGYEDKLVNMTLPFVLKVNSSEEAIEISKIVDRFESIIENSEDIRRYAQEHLTWQQQMKKIIEVIE